VTGAGNDASRAVDRRPVDRRPAAGARALALTWRAAWWEARANRRAFWTKLTMMAVNDCVWVFFWLVFFHRVGAVRGWVADDVLVLLAVFTVAGGIALGALANTRHLGRLTGSGQLDAALALPVSPLGYLLCRQVEPSGVGDIVFGLVLFCTLGQPTPGRLALFTVAALCGSVVFTGFLVIVGSLSIGSGRGPASDLALNAVMLFSSYPVDVFSSGIRVVLYGLVPAALVTSMPARLVQHPDPLRAVVVVGAAGVIALAAVASFRLGLSRYTSGGAWTEA
jgi:ABC-2 type transport system permease protein